MAGVNGAGVEEEWLPVAATRGGAAEPVGARAICGTGSTALAGLRQQSALQTGRVRTGRAHGYVCDLRNDGIGARRGRRSDLIRACLR